jgi:hypothetical protein
MIKLEKYINDNLIEFLSLGCSEVIHLSLDNFDNDTVDYLKNNYRFDYKNICIYYVKEDNNIWVENMIY